MKGYGLPRGDYALMFIDKGSCQKYGLKSSDGNVPGKGGEIHSTYHSSVKKHSVRRAYKKSARMGLKEGLQIDFEDQYLFG